MKSMIAELMYPYSAELGEGALWDFKLSRLWWVDILKGHLHRFDPSTKIDEVFDVGTPVGAIVPEKGSDVILAVKHGFARYNTESGTFKMLATVEHAHSNVRFNDGKCDPVGRFWAGTMAQDEARNAGALYCLEHNLSVTKKIDSVGISNGIGWSPKADKMYYIDTSRRNVVEYAYNLAHGSISSPRDIITIDKRDGEPDGLCVDEEGMLWVALWNGGKVIRIHPENGERLSEVVVPNVRKVTSCTFGGENLSTLFITTARQGFFAVDEKNQTNAGSLFTIDAGVRGLRANFFAYKE